MASAINLAGGWSDSGEPCDSASKACGCTFALTLDRPGNRIWVVRLSRYSRSAGASFEAQGKSRILEVKTSSCQRKTAGNKGLRQRTMLRAQCGLTYRILNAFNRPFRRHRGCPRRVMPTTLEHHPRWCEVLRPCRGIQMRNHRVAQGRFLQTRNGGRAACAYRRRNG